jgi:Carboxypeptidase regulatory-like domain/TonB-dependent Receptor Plug Domain
MNSRLALALGLLCLGWHEAAAAQNALDVHQRQCDGGELASCTVLGLIYETGAAGVRDLDRAQALYRRACDREIHAACVRLELLQDSTVTSQRDTDHRIGRVADAVTGAPVGGAVVTVADLDVRVVTDAAGRVDLGVLPRGRYRISVERFGYESFRGELPVPWATEFLMLVNQSEAAEAPTVGRVFGRVTKADSGEGLADVEVTLQTPKPITVITDAEGRFVIPALDPGTFDIRFSMLGFGTRTTSITVEAGQTVEVYPTMSPQAIELAPIEVTVGSSYLDRTGFYTRARTQGGGSTFTRADVERIAPITVADLVSRAPGVSILQTRQGSQVLGRRSVARGDTCTLRPWLDGVPMFNTFSIDELQPQDIDAIEIYQGASIPIQFRDLRSPDRVYACGVVLIWTRRDR